MDDFRSAAGELGVALDGTVVARFARFRELLLEHNQRVNLTRITDPNEIATKHFLDSLSCLRAIPADVSSLIDVGTGAGFPGLPLKLVRPEIAVTFVEAVAKKAAFLETVVTELNLVGVNVVHARAEDVGRDVRHREQHDVAVARAVAPLNVLAEYLLPLVRVGGTMLAQKGADPADELADAHAAVMEMGGTGLAMQRVSVPDLEAERHLVTAIKTSRTPERYPRRAGTPVKRPFG